MNRVPSIEQASRLISERSLSPVDLVDIALARAEALNPKLSAFIRLLPERARSAARRAEEQICMGRRIGPLHGIPYALKDIFDVAGIPTTAHSRILLENVPQKDSEVTRRLEAAGMILIGKLALHEFATGGPAWDLPWPPARNPWNTAHFTGGSSSGSGAAVAAGIVPLAMGTDTGGSIRLPAAYCGCVGLKPTYGRVSRRGVLPLSFSMDHCGPLASTVAGSAMVLQALAGYDRLDPSSSKASVPDYMAHLSDGAAGMRIGYARGVNAESGVGDEEEAALAKAADHLRDLGAVVKEVGLPPVRHFHASGRAILHSESFATHQSNLRARPGDYARVTRGRLMLGAFVTGAQYVQAQRVRRLLVDKLNDVFRSFDVLLTAPITGPAARLDDADTGAWREIQPITMLFNVTGHPAVCLPCGMSASGLPLSLQLVGSPFGEATVLRVAHAYERATIWHEQHPPV